ncbi:hypothetical protein AFB00_23995 [Pseudonocardia sp. HH130630-07]|nr:hypothetical protein AFB00_23995 [Pseudonocardia sp. HH130630-07]
MAMALVGAARSLGVRAMARELATSHMVVVSDAASVDTLLSVLGARSASEALRQWRHRTAHPAAITISLQAVNAERATVAGHASAAQIRWALQVLGDRTPEHLQTIGRLRVDYPSLSLSELGRLVEPPLNKDTVAGRLRRLREHATQLLDPESQL